VVADQVNPNRDSKRTVTKLLGALLGLYLLAIFAVSIYAGRRVRDQEDYLVAGRRLPLYLAWGTLLATWFGAATVLGAAEAARNEGVVGTVLDPFASGGALVIAGLFFARPLWKMRLLTMADFYGRTFGDRAEVVSSLVLVPGYFGWVAAQYVALAGIQVAYFGIDLGTGILIAALIVLAYTLIGGMWSVTLTDALQMMVVLVTLLILGGTTMSHLGDGSIVRGVGRLLSETPSERLTLLPSGGGAVAIVWAGTLAAGLFGNIPGQDLMQRVFSSKDARTATWACILAGVIYLLFGLIPVGLGLASRITLPGQDEGQIMAILAAEYLTTPLTVIFVVALVSIIVSTCTSAVLSPAAILSHNLLERARPLGRRRLFTDRLAVVLVTLASVTVAFSGRTILELLELSLSSVLVALFVPLVAGLYLGARSQRAALWAMVTGILVWLARELMEGLILPMPATSAAATYAGYIVAEYSAARIGALAAGALYVFALLPSAVSGTLASALGFVLGGARWSRAGELD